MGRQEATAAAVPWCEKKGKRTQKNSRDCKRQHHLRSQHRGRSVRVHGDAFMTAIEIPHKEASLLADLLPVLPSHCSLPYISSYSCFKIISYNHRIIEWFGLEGTLKIIWF